MYDCIMAMTNIIKTESPKTINNAFKATGIDKFKNLEVQSPDISVDENEQELILKSSAMKLTSSQNLAEIIDDREFENENESENSKLKPKRKQSEKKVQPKISSFFSKK